MTGPGEVFAEANRLGADPESFTAGQRAVGTLSALQMALAWSM
ncbi:hypothetical protein [Streptomyces fagopyri]